MRHPRKVEILRKLRGNRERSGAVGNPDSFGRVAAWAGQRTCPYVARSLRAWSGKRGSNHPLVGLLIDAGGGAFTGGVGVERPPGVARVVRVPAKASDAQGPVEQVIFGDIRGLRLCRWHRHRAGVGPTGLRIPHRQVWTVRSLPPPPGSPLRP